MGDKELQEGTTPEEEPSLEGTGPEGGATRLSTPERESPLEEPEDAEMATTHTRGQPPQEEKRREPTEVGVEAQIYKG